MTKELEPCPCCGGKAERKWRYTLPGEGAERFWDMCAVCGLSTKAYDTQEEADSAWNNRYQRTCHQVETEDGDLKCSECGEPLCTDYDVVDKRVKASPYCPHCGSEVLDGD